MKRISIVTGCYNEELNLKEFYARVCQEIDRLTDFEWEIIVIDNASTDSSVEILKQLAATDKRLKVIVNVRNFGHIRSPYHAIMQATGSAVICITSDLQDPPELIPTFVNEWMAGSKVVAGIRDATEASAIMECLRKIYYRTMARLADVDILERFTGFGLYDRCVIEGLREMDDPYPYFRGLISELGHPVRRIGYLQPKRRFGRSKNNFYTLFDMAMLGLTSHTKVPLRLATMFGFALSALSCIIGFGYLLMKLLLWHQFVLGMAPVVVGIFFLGAVQILFIGIIGEYIGALHTRVTRRPLVVERERINF